MLTEDRIANAVSFYQLLDLAELKMGGRRCLGSLKGRLSLPNRGVYFFFEAHEQRTTTGDGARVVRIGTHALAANSRSTLLGRLKQHRGSASGTGGNHRGSVFRLLVGRALINQDGSGPHSTWGHKSSADKFTRTDESEMEAKVSHHMAGIEVVWISVPDDPGNKSLRGVIERGAISLLSNKNREPMDPPSDDWLGLSSTSEKVKLSGLWNQNHVDERCDPQFLDCLEKIVTESAP